MAFRIIVLAIGEAGVALAALISPYFGLLVLLFMVFARPQDDRPNVVELHIPLVLTCALLLGTFARLGTIGAQFWKSLKRLRLFFLYIALMFLSAAANSFTPPSVARLQDFLTVACLCFLALIWVNTHGRVQGFIWCLIGSGFSIFLAAVRNPRYIHEQIGADSFTRLSLERSNGNFGNPNYLACLMSLLIILSLAQLNATLNKFVKLGLLALTGCFCYVLFLAQSRGASLGLAGALLCFWILQKGKVRNLLIVTAMAGFAFYAAPESYWERIASVGHYQDDRSATDRLKLWSIGLDLISNNPLLGIGPDNFESRAFNSPHDAYVQVASEMGIPALLVYLALLATAFRALWRAQLACRTLERASQPIVAISVGLTGALIIVVIQGCTTGLAHREFVYILITLSYCLQNIAEEDAGRVSVSDSEVADEVAEPANAGTGS